MKVRRLYRLGSSFFILIHWADFSEQGAPNTRGHMPSPSKERETERERWRKTKERERERVCVCVSVCQLRR